MPFVTVQLQGESSKSRVQIVETTTVEQLVEILKGRFNIPEISALCVEDVFLFGGDEVLSCVDQKEIITIIVGDEKAPQEVQEEETPRSEVEEPPKPLVLPQLRENCYMVYSNLSYQSLISGEYMFLPPGTNRSALNNHLMKQFGSKHKFATPIQLFVYFPGGVEFKDGTIGDYESVFNPKRRNLYVIASRIIPTSFLSKAVGNVCDASSNEMQILLSPLADSTLPALCQIASLLGYFNRNGDRTQDIIKALAKLCPFPPMLLALNSLAQRNSPKGQNVLEICAPLQTFLVGLAPKATPIGKIFEFACDYLTYILKFDYSDSLKLHTYNENTNDGPEGYLKRKQISQITYWAPDLEDNCQWEALVLQGIPQSVISSVYDNVCTSLKPISPLTLRSVSRTCLFTGEHGVSLYVQAAGGCGGYDMNDKLDIIDPYKGKIESVNIETLAARIGDKSVDGKAQLIDPEKVVQLTMVCFDESGSMGSSIEETLDYDPEAMTRYHSARQYLTTLANRAYAYRVFSLWGLLSFNNRITMRTKLSPLVPNFEKGIEAIDPDLNTALIDALDHATDSLVVCKSRYPNATLRIIVISDGEDNASRFDSKYICKKLIENHIIVDSCIVSTEDSVKDLVAITRLTGGLVFRPQTVEDGIKIFEQEAFLNISMRIPPEPFLGKITRTIIAERSQVSNGYDTSAPNIIIERANEAQVLATPNYYISSALSQPTQNREKRLMTELRRAATNPDPEIKVFTFASSLDMWRILLKGPDDTPYANHWWYLLVSFPEDYPTQAPIFRFISVPYHINISLEGKICLNLLDQDYSASSTVYELIVAIKMLLVLPNPDNPIETEKMRLTKSNPEEFSRRIAESCRAEAKPTAEDWINQWEILDNDNDTQTTDNEPVVAEIPAHFKCPLTGELMKEPSLASSGIYYEKQALIQHMKANANARCVVTGQLLTGDVETDEAQLNRIQQWKVENNFHD